MESSVFHIGDIIHGTVLNQLDFGMTLDAYFSTVAVQLSDRRVIKVCFFEHNHGFGPRQGVPFRARIGHSIFNSPPFTTESYFMLSDVVPAGAAVQASKAIPDPHRDPIGALNAAIARHEL
jgi:hypothetical protein